jgi:hypothetical protein
MKKIIFTQVIAENGKSTFSGLFDSNGLPVTVELEKDSEGTALTAFRRELSEFEKQEICCQYDDCDICPLAQDCDEECIGCGEDEEKISDENTCC